MGRAAGVAVEKRGEIYARYEGSARGEESAFVDEWQLRNCVAGRETGREARGEVTPPIRKPVGGSGAGVFFADDDEEVAEKLDLIGGDHDCAFRGPACEDDAEGFARPGAKRGGRRGVKSPRLQENRGAGSGAGVFFADDDQKVAEELDLIGGDHDFAFRGPACEDDAEGFCVAGSETWREARGEVTLPKKNRWGGIRRRCVFYRR